jgi:hypothetical protein
MPTCKLRDQVELTEFPEEGVTYTFLSANHLVLARGYKRVVFGKRGPYVEFSREQIESTAFHIPESCKWRQHHNKCYYIENRSNCKSFVMLYQQLHTVAYADYKVGLFYISPEDVIVIKD